MFLCEFQDTFLSCTFLSNWPVSILLDGIFQKKKKKTDDVLKPRLAYLGMFLTILG